MEKENTDSLVPGSSTRIDGNKISSAIMCLWHARTYLTFDARKVDIESLAGVQRNTSSGRSRKRREGIDRCGEEKKGGCLKFHFVFLNVLLCLEVKIRLLRWWVVNYGSWWNKNCWASDWEAFLSLLLLMMLCVSRDTTKKGLNQRGSF